MHALSTETVLAEEAIAIQGEVDPFLADKARQRPDPGPDPRGSKLGVGDDDAERCDATAKRQCELYQRLNRLNRAALCLSGGGIRSAAFSLGVIQALASHPRPEPIASIERKTPAPEPAKEPDKKKATQKVEPKPPPNVVAKPADSLLAQFQYLSTVSGGGYIGSWLSAWRLRTGFDRVWWNLVGRPCGPDSEPGTIAWLRSYSNYLSPKLGALSADTWAGIAIYLRNLLLNWLVIIPVICIVLLFIKLVAATSIGVAHYPPRWLVVASFGVLGAVSLIFALALVTRERPTRRPPNDSGIRQGVFLRWILLPATLSAGAFIQLAASNSGLAKLDHHAKAVVIIGAAIAGALIYAVSWILALPRCDDRDFWRWTLSGLVYGALMGTGAYVYNQAPMEGFLLFNDLLMPVMFGVPWIIASQMIAEMIFVGLTSFEKDSDSDREWLGRAAGWYLLTALGWFVVTFLTFAGSLVAEDLASKLETWLAPMGGVAGVVTAWVAKSDWSPGRGEQAKGTRPLSAMIILAIATPIFVAALIIFLSAILDRLLLHEPLVISLRYPDTRLFSAGWWTIAGWLLIGLAIALAIAWIASRNVNINRFSLHAVYRNRLVRAFLGASRPKRNADEFTGFDLGDNPHVYELWPEQKDGTWRPFHVINMTLNIVSTKRLSWQERKAEPFTVSPLHSGSACKAFRPSKEYADGITLGTAMAISGAAASPNMGYNSSPGITFLLALFNVRLGWWLGNPGREGRETYRHEGPALAIQPLIEETLGLTTDDRPYVYLSDGGHFENLGIYEMVRRRCRYIISVDAGADPNYTFADLGNAVRKIAIDLGITIRFYGLTKLKKRPPPGDDDIGAEHPYSAIGVIDYPAADGGDSKPGMILYIKAGYHGVEDPGIRAYAIENPAFPHQGTIDQFFSESQFESYRALGFEITDGVLSHAAAALDTRGEERSLDKIFTELRAKVDDPRPATVNDGRGNSRGGD